jgi:predicted Zn-dependent protease
MRKTPLVQVFTAQTAINLIAFVVSIWAAPLGYAQSTLPQLGDDQLMSIAAERKLGQRIARDIYRDPDYLDDPVLSDYVQRIWQPLMRAARQRGDITPELQERFAWQVMLARDRSVNAFALPGGYLGVHLGLIAMVANRDELASVLSHELSHVTQRHIARITSKQNQQAPWLLGAMILGALAARQNSDIAGAVITGSQAASAQSQLNFSRDMEREADRIGYQIMQDAQFNTQGFVGMFDKLAQANRINDNGSFPYLRSHPLTSERVGDMQSRLQLNAPAPAAATNMDTALEHAMVVRRARILANPSVDALRSEVAQTENDIRKASASNAGNPGAAQAMLPASLYAGALAAFKQRDAALAQRWSDRARELLASTQLSEPLPAAASIGGTTGRTVGPTNASTATTYALQTVALLQAELAMAQNAPERALDLLRPWISSAVSERAVLLQWARSASHPSAPKADQQMAIEALQVWLTDKPQDAPAWEAISALYGTQKYTLRAIRAQAESRVAVLDYTAALDRFKAAQDAARSGANTDHIELSIIDSRARAVLALQRDFANDKTPN